MKSSILILNSIILFVFVLTGHTLAQTHARDWGFAMQVLPPNRAVISGLITDEAGQPIPNAAIRLEQDGEEIAQTTTDASGNYRMDIYPVRGQYDLSATESQGGDWQLGIPLREGERRTLSLTLKEAISIEGTLLMLDDLTPHVAVPVQAILPGSADPRGRPQVIATTLSDENGKYRFINLKPGRYQVRCYTLRGYIYYGEGKDKLVEVSHATSLQIQRGKTLKNIDFRFAPFKKGTWRKYDPLDGSAPNVVYGIYRAADGVMWLTIPSGVARYDGRKFVNFTTADGLASNWVNDIHRDPDGVMWFGTGGGVSRYDGKEFVNFTVKNGLAHNNVRDIYVDPDGVMWFATEGGVSCYDGRGMGDFPHFVNFTTEDGLAHNNVAAIYRDPDGVMWFATEGGVSRYDGKGFVNFTTEDGLAHNDVWGIYGCPDGVMWFRTGNGVSRYDGRGMGDFPHFVSFTEKDGLASNQVNAIHRDPDGMLWFGTWGGASRYDDRGMGDSPHFVNFTTRDGLRDNVVTSIDTGPDGVLWLAMWFDGGVSRYDGVEFTNFTRQDGLASKYIGVVHRGRDGAMWFGTEDRGIVRYDGRDMGDFPRFVNFTTEDGLASNQVWAIHDEPDGVMWFGTSGGLSRYDGEEFVNFTTEDGLASDQIGRAIYHDSDGNMWVGTDGGGVSWYDGVAWTSLDTRDGLAGNTITWIHQDSDGYMWFGTGEGITRYRRDNVPPKVYIASVTTDQTYSDLSAIPAFTPGTRITIEYNAIDFKTVPEKRQYRTRITNHVIASRSSEHLVPRHKLREESAKQSELRITNQNQQSENRNPYNPPTKETTFDWTPEKAGAYIFEVQAIDRDLNYSQPASVTFTVVPPFYLRAAFLILTVSVGTLLLAALTISLLFLFKRRRQVQAYQQEAVRELQDARQMQMALLPESEPAIEGIELAGECIPANTVGGDFYDYVPLGGDIPSIVLADVSGKGMKAAMYAVLSSGVLHAESKEGVSPSQMLQILNEDLKARVKELMNCAMCIATIDLKNRILRYSNAGIPYPIVKRNREVFELECNGMPLGGLLNFEYEDVELELQTGDVVVFFSDGVTECLSKDNPEEFYEETGRLFSVIGGFDEDMNAQAMIQAILADLSDFASNNVQSDDITIVVVKVKAVNGFL